MYVFGYFLTKKWTGYFITKNVVRFVNFFLGSINILPNFLVDAGDEEAILPTLEAGEQPRLAGDALTPAAATLSATGEGDPRRRKGDCSREAVLLLAPTDDAEAYPAADLGDLIDLLLTLSLLFRTSFSGLLFSMPLSVLLME